MRIEINKRTVSPYAEEDCGNEDCSHDECRWLEGDVRVIDDEGTSEVTFDADDIEEHKHEILAAIRHLRRMESFESSIDPVPNTVPDWCWLTGRYEHPYEEKTLETTVRIYDTDDVTRAIIFAAVTA